MTTTNETRDDVHPFERAGLGLAPFRFVYVEHRVGPIRMLDANGNPTNTMVGSPGQPMGTCAYCGQGIAECCFVKSADGKVFMVGNVCIDKTRDLRLRDQTKRGLRKARREAKQKREAARIERTVGAVEREDVRAALTLLPSPNGYRAETYGETALDWARWFIANAGTTGKIKVCRVVEEIVKRLDAKRREAQEDGAPE